MSVKIERVEPKPQKLPIGAIRLRHSNPSFGLDVTPSSSEPRAALVGPLSNVRFAVPSKELREFGQALIELADQIDSESADRD